MTLPFPSPSFRRTPESSPAPVLDSGVRRNDGLVWGALLLLLAATPAFAQDATKGQAGFTVCSTCHSLDTGKNGVGPGLHGLFGRHAGTADGYNYSDAMALKDVVWNRDTLFQYLADPQAYVPGTKMLFAGVKDAKARRDLVAYLEQATK